MLSYFHDIFRYSFSVLFIVLAVSPLLVGAQAPEDKVQVTSARRLELVRLVRQDCGSCHGLTLKGGLGPALLPADLQDKPDDYLKLVILQGRHGTAMPPWSRFLNETDADWVVANLKKGFPDER